MKNKYFKTVCIILVFLLAACQNTAPEPTPTSTEIPTLIPTEAPTPTNTPVPTPFYSEYIKFYTYEDGTITAGIDTEGGDSWEKKEDGWYFYIDGKILFIGFGEFIEPDFIDFKVNNRSVRASYGTIIQIISFNIDHEKAPILIVSVGNPQLLISDFRTIETKDGIELGVFTYPRSWRQIYIRENSRIDIFDHRKDSFGEEWCLVDWWVQSDDPNVVYDPNFYGGYVLPDGQEFFWGRMPDGSVKCPTLEFVD